MGNGGKDFGSGQKPIERRKRRKTAMNRTNFAIQLLIFDEGHVILLDLAALGASLGKNGATVIPGLKMGRQTKMQ